MSKSLLRLKARELRKQGISVGNISKDLKVAKSTVSLWVRDIILSVEQLELIRKSWIKGTELGRLKGALLQKQRRINLENTLLTEANYQISSLTDRELLMSGLCLYWGEGSKKRREVSICNSDPLLINFIVMWLNKCYGVKRERMIATLGINESHKNREDQVKEYWSKQTGLPLSQFRKTSFKKVQLHKVYENFNDHYGTLRIRILKPGKLYYKIMAQILALSTVSRRSSVG